MGEAAEDRRFSAYKATNLLTGRAYIGITTRPMARRWRQHCRWNSARKSVIGAAIRKYGEAAFAVEHIASAVNMRDLLDLERILIKQHGTYGAGYNATTGGEGASGYKLTAAQRAHLSALYSGTKRPAEHCARISAGQLGRLVSATTRGMIGDAHRGKMVTAETRGKQRVAQLGKKRSPAHSRAIAAALVGNTYALGNTGTRKVSPEVKEQMEALRASGLGCRRIAAAVGLSKTTVLNVFRQRWSY